MPLADQFVEAAGAARNSRALDDIARLLWRAHGEGQIGDAEASAVSEAIEGRRRIFAAGQGFRPLSPKAVLSFPRGSPRSPDRQASLERRRRQAASGALPPAMACRFTVGEQAALAVVARQVQRHQVCVLCLAAMAGVSRSTAKNAIREARRLGLLEVRERRILGEKSLPNVVRVIDPAWLGWLRLHADRVGVKNLTPTDTAYLSKGKPQDSRQPYGGGRLEPGVLPPRVAIEVAGSVNIGRDEPDSRDPGSHDPSKSEKPTSSCARSDGRKPALASDGNLRPGRNQATNRRGLNIDRDLQHGLQLRNEDARPIGNQQRRRNGSMAGEKEGRRRARLGLIEVRERRCGFWG